MPTRKKPNKNQKSNRPEINPAKPASDTEVDLDKSKTRTYPDKKKPERH